MEKYHRLEVIKEVEPKVYPNGRKIKKVLCKCDCGNEKILFLDAIKRGTTKSCGCLRKESTTDFNRRTKKVHGHRQTKNTKTYTTWLSMKQRCLNPNHTFYSYYGGRNITICDRWKSSFKNFLEDMGERPEGKTLDRINSNGNYEPNNCKWSTSKEQISNRRTKF